jgi:hypothetical protein
MAVVVEVPKAAVADRVAAVVGHAAAEAAVTMEAVVRLALVNFPFSSAATVTLSLLRKRAGSFFGVPSMIDSLEVRVLFTT